MFLNSLIQIGSIDAQFIEEYFSVVSDRFDFSYLEDLALKEINANSIIYEIFHCINNEVYSNIMDKLKTQKIGGVTKKIKSKILKICEARIEEFSPYINCIDSWFQNECDKVGIKGKNIDEISHEVFHLLV